MALGATNLLPAVQAVAQSYQSLAANIGRSGLAAQFPADFDYWLVSLMLTNSRNQVLDTLIFPVQPESCSFSSPTLTNVRIGNQGITSLLTTQFIPFDIKIAGSFGRSWKILAGRGLSPTPSYSQPNNIQQQPEFDFAVKTGYGCMYLAKRMLDASRQLDIYGGTNRLFFFNFAFNQQYLVEIKVAPEFKQDMSTNMYWTYSFSFTALAPSQEILGQDQEAATIKFLLTANAMQQLLNTSLQLAQEYIGTLQTAITIQ